MLTDNSTADRSCILGEVEAGTLPATALARAMPTSSTTTSSRAEHHHRGLYPGQRELPRLYNLRPVPFSPFPLIPFWTCFHASPLKPRHHPDVSENYLDDNLNGALDGTPLCADTSCYCDMDTVSAHQAYPGSANVLFPAVAAAHVASKAGVSLPARDAVDVRLI